MIAGEAVDIGRRLSFAQANIIKNHAFWAVIALHTNFVLDEGLQYCMATDCAKTIWLNPEKCRELNDGEFLGVVMHELHHIVWMHDLRRCGRDMEGWNIATDYANNSSVKDELGYMLPEWVYYDPKYLNVASEVIYAEREQAAAKQQKPESGSGSGKSGQGENGSGNPDPGDSQSQDGPGAGKGKKKGKKGSAAGSGGSKGGSKGSEKAPGAGSVAQRRLDGHMPFPTGAEMEVRDLIVTAYTVWQNDPRSKEKGSLPGAMVEHIKALMKSRVPWERELHKFAGEALSREEYSYSKPHRRWLMDEDMVVPTRNGKKVGCVVIAIDSSGSISSKILNAFAGETAKLSTLVEECTIIVADVQVQQVIKTKDVPAFLKNIEIKGRGGTSHVCVFEKIKELKLEPDLFIGLTDGDTTLPKRKPRYPILWCLTKEDKKMEWGKQVFIDVSDRD